MARYFPDPKSASLFIFLNLLSLIALLLAVFFKINNHQDYAGYLLAVGLAVAAVCFIMYYAMGKIKTDENGVKINSRLPAFRFVQLFVLLSLVAVSLLLKRNHLAATYLLNAVLIGVAVFFIILFFKGGKMTHTENNSEVRPPMFRSLLMLSATIVILGLLFKVDHLPGGLFLINIGLTGSVISYIIMVLKLRTITAGGATKKKGEGVFPVNFLVILSAASVLIGLLFRINRQPNFANIFFNTGIAGFIVALIWAFVIAVKKKSQKQGENSNP